MAKKKGRNALSAKIADMDRLPSHEAPARAKANAREMIAGPQVRELSEEEWEQMADEQARKYFGISAAEFARRLKTGEMDVDDDPNGMRVAMLLGSLAE